jgi:hypothetical protein
MTMEHKNAYFRDINVIIYFDEIRIKIEKQIASVITLIKKLIFQCKTCAWHIPLMGRY